MSAVDGGLYAAGVLAIVALMLLVWLRANPVKPVPPRPALSALWCQLFDHRGHAQCAHLVDVRVSTEAVSTECGIPLWDATLTTAADSRERCVTCSRLEAEAVAHPL